MHLIHGAASVFAVAVVDLVHVVDADVVDADYDADFSLSDTLALLLTVPRFSVAVADDSFSDDAALVVDLVVAADFFAVAVVVVAVFDASAASVVAAVAVSTDDGDAVALDPGAYVSPSP